MLATGIVNALRRQAVTAGVVLLGLGALVAGTPATADETRSAEAEVCLLPEAELEQRITLYKKDVVPLVTNVERETELLTLTMKSSAEETKALADKMIALEEHCCAFLSIAYAPADDVQRITIGAGEVFLDEVAKWGLVPAEKS